MILSVKPTRLKQYKDIALLFWKYGRSDLVKRAGLEEHLTEADLRDEDRMKQLAQADELANDLEKMGPTYIKLGQLLSTRPDLIPPAYTQGLARLQDKVEPFEFSEVQRIIQEELGVKVTRAFAEIDPTPIAAASLGQVHKAVMRDGRVVAVKVQRPGIRERVVNDLDTLEDVASFLDKHTEAGRRQKFCDLLEEFRKMLLRELDYQQEAQNLVTLRRNLREYWRIVIPRPVDDFCTGKVLTMDYIAGQKITTLSPVVRLEEDGVGLAEELFKAYLQQILVDGFFHADPHPGNVFLTDDGRIALIDVGMVARLAPAFQEDLLKLTLALAEGRSDEAVEFAIKHGEKLDDFSEVELRRKLGDLVARQKDLPLKKQKVGTLMLETRDVSQQCGVRLPPEMALIGKALLNLDQIGATLAPEFDTNEAIRRHGMELMRKRFTQSFSPGNFFSRALEIKEFVQNLPYRVNQILDKVAKNELKVTVDAIDEQYLMTGMQKVANRITMGLILAALIIGAALLMRVETSFRLFGYPGLAIILFLLAAFGGCFLMFHILFKDEATRSKAPGRPRV